MASFNIHYGRFFFVCVILSVTHFFFASGAGGSVHQFSVEV